MILYASSNLVWSTRIGHAAKQGGVPVRAVRTADDLLRTLTDTAFPEGSPRRECATPGRSGEGQAEAQGAATYLVIVDLDGGEEALALIAAAAQAAKAASAPVRIVAFGPHVDVALLGRARAAGAHDVLPRGRFVAWLDRQMSRWTGSRPDSGIGSGGQDDLPRGTG